MRLMMTRVRSSYGSIPWVRGSTSHRIFSIIFWAGSFAFFWITLTSLPSPNSSLFLFRLSVIPSVNSAATSPV